MYCLWPPEGVRQKSCDHFPAQKIVCAVDGIRVSNQKQQDRSGAEGSRLWKKSRVEVEDLDVESEWSRLGSWKIRSLQDLTFGMMEIKGLLREKNGLLKRIAQSLDGGLGVKGCWFQHGYVEDQVYSTEIVWESESDRMGARECKDFIQTKEFIG